MKCTLQFGEIGGASSDERGVSEVLGSILVFALLIAVLVIVQVAGVPAANQQIEFEHNTRVQADFQEFDGNVDRAAIRGASESATVETGVRYPPRLFLINPGPASGTVSTSDPQSVTFGNARAVNEESADFFDTSSGTFAPGYTTVLVEFAPDYNEYTSAPSTVYEHGTLYNRDDDGAVAVYDEGSVVSGNRITLTMLEGELSESSTKTVSLNVNAVSAPSEVLTIEAADPSNDITLEVYTELSQNDWQNTILAGESNVLGVSCAAAADQPCNGPLTIRLDGAESYELRLAKVGVGSGYTGSESVAYVTTAPNFATSMPETGGTVKAAVRDRFNNPVSGVEVTFTAVGGDYVTNTFATASTDEDGVASVAFAPDLNAGTATVYAGIDRDSDNSVQDELPVDQISYAVTVVNSTTNFAASEINPYEPGSLLYKQAAVSSNQGTATHALFYNDGGQKNLTGIRLSFYSTIGDPGKPKNYNSDYDLLYPTAVAGGSSTVGEELVQFGSPLVVPADTQVCFGFDLSESVFEGDLYGITIQFDDGSRSRYFVQPTQTTDLCAGAPTADAGPDQTVPPEENVNFDASASSDADGSIAGYEWDFDNDGVFEGSGETPTLTGGYATTGDKIVTLRVTDNDGLTDTDTMTVSVGNGGGVPSITTFSGLVADKQNDEFSIQTLSVSDSDSNLDRVEIEVTRSGNTNVIASDTVPVTGDSDSISPTLTTAQDVKQNEAFDITVTVFDADGQSATQTKQVTST